jgi:hypothetical protein
MDALYRASAAGEGGTAGARQVLPAARVPALQRNIVVTSVVGRFLDMHGFTYFANGGQEELLVGSADMMLRNLDRRVEVLFPIKDPKLRAEVRGQHPARVPARHGKMLATVSGRLLRAPGSRGGRDPVQLSGAFSCFARGGSWREE